MDDVRLKSETKESESARDMTQFVSDTRVGDSREWTAAFGLSLVRYTRIAGVFGRGIQQ